MRLSLNDAQLSIRDEMRAFLAANLPDAEDVPTAFDARVAWLRDWQRRLAEARLVNIAWPDEYGGRGATLLEQIVANQELARAGAPELVGVVGLEVVGPSILHHGRPDQKEAYLRRILTGEDIWCQGFSEPGAGSDLASLRARAVDHGDHYVLTGQKVWTSWAQYANWCAVLARTDTDAGHRGISYLIVDMRSPGIEVRPLTQITGDAEFSEVYFDGVVVPHQNVLGAPGQGWALAMHTLTNERGPVVLSVQVKLRVALDSLVQEAARLCRDSGPALAHPRVRDSLTRAHVAVEVLKHQAYRSMGSILAKGGAGPESSVDKLFVTEAQQRVGEAALEVLGPFAGLIDGPGGTGKGLPWQHNYMYSRAVSIYGGTSQIQKNIVAERVLGLPRSG